VDKLATVLGNCRAAAIVIGAQGLGRWQQRERDLALDRQTRDRTFPVIPVLLPGAEPALDFLGLNTWIDLRQRVDDPLHLDILAKAVHGEAPGPDLLHSVVQMFAEICPYRGLRWFREEDARFFCGRDACIEKLNTAVESKHDCRSRCIGQRQVIGSARRRAASSAKSSGRPAVL
jgi:hypothetical protein